MLFQFIDKVLDCAIDTLNYGPLEAARINTSFCPQAERDYKEVNKKVQKEIDRTFSKIERDLEYQKEHPEAVSANAKTADEVADDMIANMNTFMNGWMSNLYKNNRVTEEDIKEVMEEADVL